MEKYAEFAHTLVLTLRWAVAMHFTVTLVLDLKYISTTLRLCLSG